jgi:hypothetical protein
MLIIRCQFQGVHLFQNQEVWMSSLDGMFYTRVCLSSDPAILLLHRTNFAGSKPWRARARAYIISVHLAAFNVERLSPPLKKGGHFKGSLFTLLNECQYEESWRENIPPSLVSS